MKTYFALPLETKMEARALPSDVLMTPLDTYLHQLDNTKTPNFKGYNAVLSSKNDPNGAADMHEGFEFGWEALNDALNAHRSDGGAMAGANVWPDVPGFRDALLRY
jgi:isopenicillin N synthase-like dioxygenase